MGSSIGAGNPYRPYDGPGERAHVPAATPGHASRWRQVFKGEERQLGLMRLWLASLLPEGPARDDVISVATELGSNALLHTASGHGGWFAVVITRHRSFVRIEVADRGGPEEPHVIEDPDGEHGRGLLLVHGLAARTGVTGGQQGRTVWAEIAWDDPDAATLAASMGPTEAEIRDGEAALARRFAGVPAWFGRATQAWWAVAGLRDLVSAPTAPELAGKLYRLLENTPRPRASATEHAHGSASGPRFPYREHRQGTAGQEAAPREHPGSTHGRARPGASGDPGDHRSASSGPTAVSGPGAAGTAEQACA